MAWNLPQFSASLAPPPPNTLIRKLNGETAALSNGYYTFLRLLRQFFQVRVSVEKALH